MSPENGTDHDGQLVDAFVRYLRGHGPRPPADAAAHLAELFELLEAIAGTAEVPSPPIEADPAAARLGLVDPRPDAVTVSLAELAHRFGADLEVTDIAGEADPAAPGDQSSLRLRAVCRTLGEVVLVATFDGDDVAVLPRRAAALFARHPSTSAVAAVSTTSLLAVVLTEADCVAAIDPTGGWAEPALPRAPEPFGIALGRHLERSLPRWEAVARLDEMLVLAGGGETVAHSARRALRQGVERPVRIPARRAALGSLRSLDAAEVVAVVEEVRRGELHGDQLIRRIRLLSEIGAP